MKALRSEVARKGGGGVCFELGTSSPSCGIPSPGPSRRTSEPRLVCRRTARDEVIVPRPFGGPTPGDVRTCARSLHKSLHPERRSDKPLCRPPPPLGPVEAFTPSRRRQRVAYATDKASQMCAREVDRGGRKAIQKGTERERGARISSPRPSPFPPCAPVHLDAVQLPAQAHAIDQAREREVTADDSPPPPSLCLCHDFFAFSYLQRHTLVI